MSPRPGRSPDAVRAGLVERGWERQAVRMALRIFTFWIARSTEGSPIRVVVPWAHHADQGAGEPGVLGWQDLLRATDLDGYDVREPMVLRLVAVHTYGLTRAQGETGVPPSHHRPLPSGPGIPTITGGPCWASWISCATPCAFRTRSRWSASVSTITSSPRNPHRRPWWAPTWRPASCGPTSGMTRSGSTWRLGAPRLMCTALIRPRSWRTSSRKRGCRRAWSSWRKVAIGRGRRRSAVR